MPILIYLLEIRQTDELETVLSDLLSPSKGLWHPVLHGTIGALGSSATQTVLVRPPLNMSPEAPLSSLE